MHLSKILAAGAALSVISSIGLAAPTIGPTRPNVVESYGKLPMSFEANQGQTDAQVKFLSRGSGYTLFLTRDGAVLSLHEKDATSALRMKLLGANRQSVIAGADTLPGKNNYFIGNDPKQWQTNVPTYGAVKYAGVYPGIDLVYHGNQRLLEYDFVVAPGADPSAIDLRFDGARKLSVNADGALVIAMGSDEVIEHAPVVYQDIGGERKTLSGRYVLRGNGRVSFSIAPYDRSQPLVIDPTLSYATFLGGMGDEIGLGIAVDGTRNAYVVGYTTSLNFPTTKGAVQPVVGANGAGFVSKLNADGTALIYSTYLGGSAISEAASVVVDAAGNAYVAGSTQASDFPTTPGAYETTYPNSSNVGFVTKLNATGTALVYSTFMDGGASSIGIDGSGNAYVMSNNAAYSGVAKKLNTSGSAVVASYGQNGGIMALDSAGNIYVASSYAINLNYSWPMIYPNCMPTSNPSRVYTVVEKWPTDGTSSGFSTCLGGGYGDTYADSIAVDANGSAYITGTTAPYPGFPTWDPVVGPPPGCPAPVTYLAKINSSGLVYSVGVGCSSYYPSRTVVAVDSLGDAIVTGTDFLAFGAYDPNGRPADYVGYNQNAVNGTPGAITTDRWGGIYITGNTSNVGPLTMPAFQPNFGGGASDAFVNKSPGAHFTGPATTASVAGWLGNNGWYRSAVTITLSAGVLGDSKVAATYYSVDGGPYQTYKGPFSISTDGTHHYQFYSVDTAGNHETANNNSIGIDSTPPVSRVAPLPAIAPSQYIYLQWSASDAASGVAMTCQEWNHFGNCTDHNYGFNIYLSTDNGPFTLMASNINYNSNTPFIGQFGHTYGFYSITEDLAGNVENKWTADAVTTVPAQLSAYDLDHDGYVDCGDVAIVKASFGKKAGQSGFDPRADVNHDGVVDVRDVAAVTQKMMPGTTCH